MIRLSKGQVIKIHSMLIEQTGGSDGIRDDGLLDSALNAPFQTFDGEYIYGTIKARAAKLGYFLVKNHPFIDGNKKTGVLVIITFVVYPICNRVVYCRKLPITAFINS